MEDIVARLKADLGKELAIIDLYQKYAKQVQDPEARELLMILISESMGHADAFRGLLHKRAFGIEPGKHGLSEVALSNLLYFGMKEEREIRLAYERDLSAIGDEEYAGLLKKIIADEKRHEEMLKQAYARLSQQPL